LGWPRVEPYVRVFVVDVADVTCIRYAESGDQCVARWSAMG
jgi:hypothetical protein